MRFIAISIFILASMAGSITADAQPSSRVIKYQVENGVKVYRNTLSAEDRAIRRAKLRTRAEDTRIRERQRQQSRMNNRIIHQQQKAYQDGFSDGVRSGKQQARTQCRYCNRRRIRLRQRIRTRPRVSSNVLSRRNLQ